jgi:hypothetical protein
MDDDRKQAKRQGMSVGEYEGSPEDRRRDIRNTIKKAVATSKANNLGKRKGGY